MLRSGLVLAQSERNRSEHTIRTTSLDAGGKVGLADDSEGRRKSLEALVSIEDRPVLYVSTSTPPLPENAAPKARRCSASASA